MQVFSNRTLTHSPSRAATLSPHISHKGAAKAAFDKAHMDLLVENVDEDMVKQDLINKLQAATGAHKPNGYEFDVGEFLDADYYGRGVGKAAK